MTQVATRFAPRRLAAALAAFALAFGLSANAQATEKRSRHHPKPQAVHAPLRTNDLAPESESYLNPGTSTGRWTEQHYVGDTVNETDPGLVNSFGNFRQSSLPSRFDTGQEPLFRF